MADPIEMPHIDLPERSPLRAENARLLTEVARLEAQLREWMSSAEMACENPPPGCDCSGCSLAREKGEEAQ